ncbi:MAG: sigma 54-interacting transcriptional regulator, partial [Erysipelotrichaceae bacterium]|nr:sigma 54-interacting transcriptional regulator [Erysipelotrichaceae bacterium]
LIKGDKGLRKRSFVNAIFEHARKEGIKPADSRLIIINCQEYSDSDDGFFKRIFGYEDVKGAFELANKGIVFLQNIHTLPYSEITPVTDAISQGYYSKVGEIRQRKLEVSVIASVNDNVDERQMEYLESIFPMVVEIPSFNRRNIYEKIEMILSLFTDEAKALDLNIMLYKSILSIFLQYHYEENERQLMNYVRITCANALSHQDTSLENVLHIDLDHLPMNLIAARNDFNDDAFFVSALNLFEKEYILCESDGRCEGLEFFRSIQNKYYEKNLMDFSKQFYLNDDRISELDRYLDESIETVLHCDEAHYHRLRSFVSSEVRLVFLKEIFSDPYFVKITENNRILYAMMASISGYLKQRPELKEIEYEIPDSKEAQCARRITEQLSIDSDTIVFYITRYLEKALSYLENIKPGILLVGKGESIASQYKQLCNAYAQDNGIRIEAVDYREDLQYNDLLELIYNRASAVGNNSGVIIITDTYPIVDMENNIREKTDIRCKVIAPLSYDLIIRCVDEINRSSSIDTFMLNTKINIKKERQNESDDEFIERFTKDVLSKTLTHINPDKAVETLLRSLDEILVELSIIKTRDIIVKYLSHGVHMLERIIKHQPLNYYQLNRFTAENHDLMDIIAKSLSAAENTFDLSVPSCEIAYLA